MSPFDGRWWRKSTFSGSGGCVEVLPTPGAVQVRDTKDREGSVLTFTHDEWRAFTQGVKNLEFDIEDPAEQ